MSLQRQALAGVRSGQSAATSDPLPDPLQAAPAAAAGSGYRATPAAGFWLLALALGFMRYALAQAALWAHVMPASVDKGDKGDKGNKSISAADRRLVLVALGRLVLVAFRAARLPVAAGPAAGG